VKVEPKKEPSGVINTQRGDRDWANPRAYSRLVIVKPYNVAFLTQPAHRGRCAINDTYRLLSGEATDNIHNKKFEKKATVKPTFASCISVCN
jgi:hypothetical protein